MAFILLIAELSVGRNEIYIEFLGAVSAIIEAILAVPQFLKNLKNKSTEGLS